MIAHVPSATIDKTYLTREEASEYLSVAPQTLAVWASTGRHGLPYIKIGRTIRYRKSDLDAWLESHIVGKK